MYFWYQGWYKTWKRNKIEPSSIQSDRREQWIADLISNVTVGHVKFHLWTPLIQNYNKIQITQQPQLFRSTVHLDSRSITGDFLTENIRILKMITWLNLSLHRSFSSFDQYTFSLDTPLIVEITTLLTSFTILLLLIAIGFNLAFVFVCSSAAILVFGAQLGKYINGIKDWTRSHLENVSVLSFSHNRKRAPVDTISCHG